MLQSVSNEEDCTGFGACSLVAMLVGASTFGILLSLKISYHFSAAFTWTAVFSPLYLCFILCALSPCAGWIWATRRVPFCIGLWLLLLAPLLIFTVLLNVLLEIGAPMKLAFALIPLFLQDAIFLFLFLKSDGDNITVLTVLIWLCTQAPWIVFKVLLSIHFDGEGMNWEYVFIPLYIPLALLLLTMWMLIHNRWDDRTYHWPQRIYRFPRVPVPI